MRTLRYLHWGATGLLMLGVIVVWGASMPHELNQENSRLIGGMKEWCGCKDVVMNDHTCADAPDEICLDRTSHCPGDGPATDWCRDSGDKTCDDEECLPEDGYIVPECS